MREKLEFKFRFFLVAFHFSVAELNFLTNPPASCDMNRRAGLFLLELLHRFLKEIYHYEIFYSFGNQYMA
ncbi:MAG: hypothetical protein KJ666_06925 [Bacteroidetes bacterium]|nr:hypothetical protein [Bacteroidota bacterium]